MSRNVYCKMTIPQALLTVYLTFLKEMYTNRRTQVKKRVQNKKNGFKNIEFIHKWTWLM